MLLPHLKTQEFVHDEDGSFDGRFPKSEIGSVKEHTTMHYFGIPKKTRSMIAYKFSTAYSWGFV